MSFTATFGRFQPFYAMSAQTVAALDRFEIEAFSVFDENKN